MSREAQSGRGIPGPGRDSPRLLPVPQIKKAFFALVANGVRAAPLWDSKQQSFVGEGQEAEGWGGPSEDGPCLVVLRLVLPSGEEWPAGLSSMMAPGSRVLSAG